MRGLNKILSVAAASAAFAIAVPANAAVVLCSSGPGIDLTADQCTAPGNDDLTSVEAAIAAATGVNVSLLNLTFFGKSDDNPSLFSFSPNADPSDGKVTTFTVLDGTLITYATVKAATDFKVYQFGGAGVSTGSLSTLGLLTNGGRQPDISHISFWTTPNSAVPEPGTWGMMLFGFGAIGFAMRRRRGKADARVRFAF